MRSDGSETLAAEHVVEFPGGYTRSTGPVIGRFLTELRDGRLVGVRTRSGRVLMPPMEYDPDDGSPVTDEYVPVGPAGTVTTWSWVAEPRAGHPLPRPFAWALVTLDGADTPMLHALDAGPGKGAEPPRGLTTGLRVRPKFREQRSGSITDIEYFRPEVTGIVTPTKLRYRIEAGQELTRYLDGMVEGKILGMRSRNGGVYVPLRETDPTDGSPAAEVVELPDAGTVTTFTVNHVPDPRAPEVPFVTAYVRLDGADVDLLTLVSGIPADQVRSGMRVRAQWLPPEERSRTKPGIAWFVPEDRGRDEY